MRKTIFIINLVVAALTLSAAPIPKIVMQADQTVSITSPVEGEIISGVVDIIGTSKTTGFSRFELAFSNAIGPIETWFLLTNSSKSVQDDLIYSWDTTTITDGDYRLRLRVITEDNSIKDIIISDLTIQNYTPTMLPSLSPTSDFIAPTETKVAVSETPVLSPTGLPENPLSLTTSDLAMSLVYGIITILGLIGISSVYSHLKRK